MSADKNFLQTIKLEISRNFKLLPYERLVFHRILGILKSDAGLSIMIAELERGRDIRSSAISVLTGFDNPGLIDILLPYLELDVYESDRINILKMLLRKGDENHLPLLFGFIESTRGSALSRRLLSFAFDCISVIGRGSNLSKDFLLGVIEEGGYPDEHVFFAIKALSSFEALTLYEKILATDDDNRCHAVFSSITVLLNDMSNAVSKDLSEEDRLYTYNPENEEGLVLNLRVILGKYTSHFDLYSGRTKTAFISALISCNHREYLIYVMKALTSGDYSLIRRTLYTIHAYIDRLRDPDKLFRSLIALSVETDRDNGIIVSIFIKYFSLPIDSRQFNLMRDKMFSYIVVTMDTYFEMFRKEFMISDIAEKGYPENFQSVRLFILNKLTPDIKKKIIQYLLNEDNTMMNHIIKDIGAWLRYADDYSRAGLELLFEILYEKDKKTRSISASRIEDINFEKRYLKNRIIRLCRIISGLEIAEAASPLVNIYNYLKKYPEEGLMDEIIHTLSNLNYSYMLGEIEVQLNTGSPEEKKTALGLIALFTEQRSLNIVMEFMQSSISDSGPLLTQAASILAMRDIKGNVTAEQLFKMIIEKHPYGETACTAVLGIGVCGLESDFDYLHELFMKSSSAELKESIIRAMGSIISENETINRKLAVRYLHDYLRDPGIRVRIYSCLLLVKLGDKDSVRSIRDMLIIKNKGIQRDILSILGNLKSLEFSFFLLSLLKEEYGISRDIVNVLSILPVEDMKEIDGFIVNIFRKFEAPEIEGFDQKVDVNRQIAITGMTDAARTILRVELSSRETAQPTIPGLIDLNIMIKELIVKAVVASGGIIAGISERRVLAVFNSPESACAASLAVSESVDQHNRTRAKHMRVKSFIKIISGNVKTIQEELIEYPDYAIEETGALPFENKAVLDSASADGSSGAYSMSNVPENIFGGSGDVYELLSPVNYTSAADAVYKKIVEEEEKRVQTQLRIEADMKKLRREVRSPSSLAVARELDNIGHALREQLDEIERYMQRSSTEKDVVKNVKKMLDNTYNLYKVEVSRILIE